MGVQTAPPLRHVLKLYSAVLLFHRRHHHDHSYDVASVIVDVQDAKSKREEERQKQLRWREENRSALLQPSTGAGRESVDSVGGSGGGGGGGARPASAGVSSIGQLLRQKYWLRRMDLLRRSSIIESSFGFLNRMDYYNDYYNNYNYNLLLNLDRIAFELRFNVSSSSHWSGNFGDAVPSHDFLAQW